MGKKNGKNDHDNSTQIDNHQGQHLRSPKRRRFLESVGGAAALTVAAGAIGIEPALNPSSEVQASQIGPMNPTRRANRCFKIRQQVAQRATQDIVSLLPHPSNGDEVLFNNKFGNYSKGLPHNEFGEVDLAAWDRFITALRTGLPVAFEQIPMGISNPSQRFRLVNPQSGLAFDLEGDDAQKHPIPPAPAFSSSEEAGEIVENYWMALLRDVDFRDYGSNSIAQQAADELNSYGDDFKGAKDLSSGRVTPDTLFRGLTPGDLNGPYLSQFFWRPAPFGAQFVDQLARVPVPNVDFMTDYQEWLAIQNGSRPARSLQFLPARRYMVTGRDLSQWVHIDVLFQGYFDACLIMLTPPDPSGDLTAGGLGCPLNPGNPYNSSLTQDPFGTFGPPAIKALVCEVASRALKAVWFTKWFVHRRLRPEAFSGALHLVRTGQRSYPVHQSLMNSAGADAVFDRFGSYLLPMAFPEGSPLHPAYGAGHATVAGACVTILKAMFDENFVIPNPMQPDPSDPTRLTPYTGAPLTVGGELNKLASNVAIGRNIAGVHWRSDATESLILGEKIAISILRDQRAIYNEEFGGFTFTKFDGTQATV